MARKKTAFYPSKRIALIPLDARPVCYTLPKQLAEMAGIELVLPSPNILGQLKTPADETALFRWLKHHLAESIPTIVALDTIAYGGLISSRVGHESFQQLKDRLQTFFNILPSQTQRSPVVGFSSILRIPAYNNAEEEPDYWAQYGKALYDYSFAAHQNPSSLAKPPEHIPADTLNDFLERRTRNFDLNQSHLARLENKELHYLAFCQDDTGAYGLNVQEALALETQIEHKHLATLAHVQTGADEVASCFLARLVSLWYQETHTPLSIAIEYSDPDSANTVAKFDGIPIRQIVERAITTCGTVIANDAKTADMVVWVHTPPADTPQGDHCESPWNSPNAENITQAPQHQRLITGIQETISNKTPVIIADVAYANGGDPLLIRSLLDEASHIDNIAEHLYGYAGWNTPGNTIGTAIAMGVLRLLAEKNGTFNLDIFKEALLVRFADDWLYQAIVRKSVRKTFPPDKPLPEDAQALLNKLMSMELPHLQERLELEDKSVNVSFPCSRTFEIEIKLEETTAAAV